MSNTVTPGKIYTRPGMNKLYAVDKRYGIDIDDPGGSMRPINRRVRAVEELADKDSPPFQHPLMLLVVEFVEGKFGDPSAAVGNPEALEGDVDLS